MSRVVSYTVKDIKIPEKIREHMMNKIAEFLKAQGIQVERVRKIRGGIELVAVIDGALVAVIADDIGLYTSANDWYWREASKLRYIIQDVYPVLLVSEIAQAKGFQIAEMNAKDGVYARLVMV